MPETDPAQAPIVQLAYIRGMMAELKKQSEASCKGLDSLSGTLTSISIRVDHYSRKVDEIHHEIVGNGGPGFRQRVGDHETRITVMERMKVPEAELVEERIANVGGVSKLEVAHVKGSSIDWKWLALFAVNALVVVILAATNLK